MVVYTHWDDGSCISLPLVTPQCQVSWQRFWQQLVTRMMQQGWPCIKTSVSFPCRFSGKWDGRQCWDGQTRKASRDPPASGNDWYGGTEFVADWGEREGDVHWGVWVMCSIQPPPCNEGPCNWAWHTFPCLWRCSPSCGLRS